MEEPSFWYSVDIPPIFHSFLTGRPFEKCLVCEKELRECGPYMIEKAFKGTEVIFEYAICVACCQSMESDLSEDSLRRIRAYIEERVDFEDRYEELMESDGTIDAWIDQCVITKIPRAEAEEFQIVAYAQGSLLIPASAPFMISGQAMEDVQKLLSKKTRDRLDDFSGDFLGLPSEFKQSGPLF